jgi:N-acetylglucosaminyldiphosphoundecaprenol N-acetyl-beta-D-mannosaminyltransferase
VSEPGDLPVLDVLGVRVHAMTLADLFADITRAVEGGRPWLIGYHNLHSVYLHHHDADMRRYCERADRLFIDGMGLVLAARIAGYPVGRRHRSTSVDWIGALVELAAARGWRVFLLGSRPGVAARAADVLRARAPAARLEHAHGYFDVTAGGQENEAVLARIRAFRPHLLLVGMGMPRQEKWLMDNQDRLPPVVALNLGAIFDYLGGEVPTPPRWLSRLGFEWLGRLVAEPRRLAARYLAEPWTLVPLLLSDVRRRWSSGVGERADARHP